MASLAEIHAAHAAAYAAVLSRGRVGGGDAADRGDDGASNEPRDGGRPPPPVFWDAVVLTAADDAQAEGFRRQLEAQRLPACEYVCVCGCPSLCMSSLCVCPEGEATETDAGTTIPACVSVSFLVVADPPGPKIGNGGATLVALELLERTYGSARLDASTAPLRACGHAAWPS